MDSVYPVHLSQPIRRQVAISYLKHEFRKLFPSVPETCWPKIDKDITAWPCSPELVYPRDFWNGFHGVSMGFKLKIGLLSYLTAENISWHKKSFPIAHLCFGADLHQTKLVAPGKLPAIQVIKFYQDPKNKKAREKQLRLTLKKTKNSIPRDQHPIIVVQKKESSKTIHSVYDGNRRLIKAILENKAKINIFLGTFSQGCAPSNYWIPTTLLMENLFFARRAHERGDQKTFNQYINILKDITRHSPSGRYELKERAIVGPDAFQKEVLQSLGF